jgi:L-seryl-tRNA(Ser) seleniumtransferase
VPNPILKNIPSVNELLESPPLRSLVDKVSRNVVVSEVRAFLDNLRGDLQAAAADMAIPSPGELAERIAQWIDKDQQPRLRPVVNATGILLHTGLGRAPLAREAVEEIAAVAEGYSSVEIDIKTGQRSQRVQAVEKLLCELTGAEAATVVNNNAGATLLTLAAVAAGREVIVSRGQLIEIGGSFRLPEVMQTSGATLREVGTTNKTRIADYEKAIGPSTAALMRVHPSNFKIVGFTQEATLAELVELGHRHHLPVIDDIGSGALIDFARYSLEGEPVAAGSVQAGADLVLFSGDKLLGGPQAGIIVGRRNFIQQISRHPLMRALRVDKLTLAALAATLRLYRDPNKAENALPLLSLLATSVENLKNRAERLAPQMAAARGIARAEPVSDTAFLGGGSLPTQQLATWCIALAPAEGSADELAMALRTGTPSVVGRIQRDLVLLDLRSVPARHDELLLKAVEQYRTGGDK